MLAERYLRRRFAEGKEEGRAERDAEWSAWVERYKAAAEAGQPFEEPPPNQS